MPPSVPLDEHGFPIPPTFDDPQSQRRPSQWLGRAWQVGLVLTFILLLAGWVLKSGLGDGLGEGLNNWMASRLLARAQQKYQLGDFPGALADVEHASRWLPNHPDIIERRAYLKLKTNDVAGSLADYDQVVRLDPRRTSAYLSRSTAYQRLRRYPEAVQDLTKVVDMMPRDAMPLNNRAYARALGGIELDAALVDVQQAIDIVDQEMAEEQAVEQMAHFDLETAQRRLARIATQKAAYLDTRGYVRFLQEDYEPALKDLTEAIELCANSQNIVITELPRPHRSAARQQFDEELSVMYHHRGQVLEKLGRHEEAQSDLDRAEKLGYNPDQGVF